MSDSQRVIRKTIWEQFEEPFMGVVPMSKPSHLSENRGHVQPQEPVFMNPNLVLENIVGRSLPFFQWLTPIIQRSGQTADIFQRKNFILLPIRSAFSHSIEADETTYNLHIIIRFQLNKLFSMVISPFRIPRGLE